MLYHVSDLIVYILFLPVFMNIVLPLGMLAVWLLGRGVRFVFGGPGTVAGKVGLAALGRACL